MRKVLVAVALLGTALVFPGPASAQQIGKVCISNGIAYQVGEVACIPACHGAQRLARCDAVAELASWTTISTQCPNAEMTPIPQGGQSRPVRLARNMTPAPPVTRVPAASFVR